MKKRVDKSTNLSVEEKVLLNKQYIYTTYSKEDIKLLEQMLLSPIKSGVITEVDDFKKLLSKIGVSATNNFISFVDFKIQSQNKPIVLVKNINSKINKSLLGKTLNISNAVIGSFLSDINKSFALDNVKEKVDSFKLRAKQIAQCEVARVTNTISQDLANKNGFSSWMWGASSNANSREEHEILYGEISAIGETPAENGEYPAELVGCGCQMIFIKDE